MKQCGIEQATNIDAIELIKIDENQNIYDTTINMTILGEYREHTVTLTHNCANNYSYDYCLTYYTSDNMDHVKGTHVKLNFADKEENVVYDINTNESNRVRFECNEHNSYLVCKSDYSSFVDLNTSSMYEYNIWILYTSYPHFSTIKVKYWRLRCN